MSELQIASVRGAPKGVDRREISRLRATLAGTVLTAADIGYHEARAIWNAMIDRRPALIARCQNVTDVQQTIDFARKHGLLVSIRGGGHNIAGNAVHDGAVMIDMSLMRGVRVDTLARRAHVEGGATLADLDAATQAHGLATPVGISSTTGLAGLALGGGFGWLSRKHGMTVDNLVGAEVVLADGTLVRADAEEHPNLFWALRGGGGNFGVVTRFELALHPIGPEVLCGLVVYDAHAEGLSVLRRYREAAAALGDETTAWVILRKAPPLPFLRAETHGTDVVVVAFLHAGNPEAGHRAVEPLRWLGKPVGQHVGVQPFVGWQQAFDPLLTKGARNYWKSHNLDGLTDDLLEILLRAAHEAPSPHSEVILAQLGGATARVAPSATAYAHRAARYVMNVHGRWMGALEDAAGVGWARKLHDAVAPHATGGVYVNFMSGDEGERVRAAYGPNYARLQAAKRLYDPENLFRVNQNIRPE